MLIPYPLSHLSAGFTKYEMEEDVTKDLVEFGLANAIFAALVEGNAAEISARRTAMENASKVSTLLAVAERRKAVGKAVGKAAGPMAELISTRLVFVSPRTERPGHDRYPPDEVQQRTTGCYHERAVSSLAPEDSSRDRAELIFFPLFFLSFLSVLM